jgi:hypothetical protein
VFCIYVTGSCIAWHHGLFATDKLLFASGESFLPSDSKKHFFIAHGRVASLMQRRCLRFFEKMSA